MQEMGYYDVKAHYNHSHFANEPIMVGNVCWVVFNDNGGKHEFPVHVVEQDEDPYLMWWDMPEGEERELKYAAWLEECERLKEK